MRITMNKVVLFAVLAAMFVAFGCSNNSASTDVDGDAPEFNGGPDGDTDAEMEGEIEAPSPCTTGQAKCADDSDVAVLVCDEEQNWVYDHSCIEGRVCDDGACIVPLPEDGDTTPDGDVPDGDLEWHCSADLDCGYGSGCDPTGPGDVGDGCVNKMECRRDEDCAEGLLCVDMSNWKACMPSQNDCETMEDCDYGYACVDGEDGWTHCEDANECYNSVECPENMVCSEGGHWRVCQPDGVACTTNDDCDFGYKCYTDWPQPICVLESNCSVDTDCPVMQVCMLADNWKTCSFDLSPTWCQDDAACAEGEFCDTITCKSKDQCANDDDCDTGYRCQEVDGYEQCVETPPCTQDSECGFGYQCNSGDCIYANQCTNDQDCATLQACKPAGNYTTCQLDTPSICTGDDGCDEDEFCDTLLAIGECRSRSQCFIDEDCGEGMKCESNGHYNTCVADNPMACWFDFQCSSDWVCTDGECRPVYEGTCGDVEGMWTVWVSDCTLITTGQAYEFVPTNGCNGNIHIGESQIPAGNFSETSQYNYDVTFTFKQCTAEVLLGVGMNMNCGDCFVEMGRL